MRGALAVLLASATLIGSSCTPLFNNTSEELAYLTSLSYPTSGQKRRRSELLRAHAAIEESTRAVRLKEWEAQRLAPEEWDRLRFDRGRPADVAAMTAHAAAYAKEGMHEAAALVYDDIVRKYPMSPEAAEAATKRDAAIARAGVK